MVASHLSTIPFTFLTIALLIAAINDIRSHKIPNWLTLTTMVAGIFYNTFISGLNGFLFSAGGVAVGIAVLIIPYLFKGTGAGDVKLMGSVGGFLGPKGVFIAFLFTSFVGGIYAMVLLALHGFLKETAKRYGSIIKAFIFTRSFIYIPPSKNEEKPKMCYGIAIALGTLISVGFGMKI